MNNSQNGAGREECTWHFESYSVPEGKASRLSAIPPQVKHRVPAGWRTGNAVQPLGWRLDCQRLVILVTLVPLELKARAWS